MCITNRTMFKKEIENYLRSHKGCLAWRLPIVYNLVAKIECLEKNAVLTIRPASGI